MPPRKRVAIIGAGSVGLSSALCLSQNLSFVDVSIYADRFTENTLSYGAGGFFWPDDNIGETREVTRQWFRDSFEHYVALANSSEAGSAGIQRISGFTLSSLGPEHLTNSIIANLFPDFRPATQKEMKLFPPQYKYGAFFTTLIADPRQYLKWLTKRTQNLGVKYFQRTICNFSELEDYDLVINCSGLRAKELLEDDKLRPDRGQVLKVKAPWIKHFYCADRYHIVPGIEYVTVGGTHQIGNYQTEVCEYDKKQIWDKCTELLPSLKQATFGYDWVGLRPFRLPVRVEMETIDTNEKQVQVIHNYGHGSHGINLSWGTAKHVSSIAENLFTSY